MSSSHNIPLISFKDKGISALMADEIQVMCTRFRVTTAGTAPVLAVEHRIGEQKALSPNDERFVCLALT